jgi:hypothetical protein
MIVPAQSTEDLAPGVNEPTHQCGDVWRYAGLTSGYQKYQSCAWMTNGSHDVTVHCTSLSYTTTNTTIPN